MIWFLANIIIEKLLQLQQTKPLLERTSLVCTIQFAVTSKRHNCKIIHIKMVIIRILIEIALV